LDIVAGFEKDFQVWRKSRTESLFDDYAELSHYRAANARFKPPAQSEDRVVFLGDSITEGWNLDEYFPDKPYVNRGIGSQTTSQMLLRFRQDVIALRPRAVVILAGANDIGGNTGPMLVEDIEANCASMAEIARTNGIRVIFSSLLPPPHKCTPSSLCNFVKHPPERTLTLNRWLKEYSVAGGCDFLDYFTAMSDDAGFLKRDFSEDGLHPTPAGYQIMAPLAHAAITRVLGGEVKRHAGA